MPAHQAQSVSLTPILAGGVLSFAKPVDAYETERDIAMWGLMIWSGAVVSLIGLAAILYCITRVARAKRARLDDEALRSELQAVLPINLGAMFLSVIGLMMVALGVILG
jgi:hypothetical protein